MLNIQYLNIIITILLDSNHVKACIRFWQDYMMIYSTQKNKKRRGERENGAIADNNLENDRAC